MSATFTVSVTGTHGTHNTTVPVECPSEKTLRSMGQYPLGAYASRYPLAAQVLADKRAKEAKADEAAAAREAKRPAKAKASTFKPSTGNEPGAVDTAKTNPGTSTTVHHTTLATATQAQLITALVTPLVSMADLVALVDAFDAALDAKEAKLLDAEMDKPMAAPTPKADAPKAKADDVAPTAKPVPAPAPKQETAKAKAEPTKAAAQTAQQETAKVDAPAPKAAETKAAPAKQAGDTMPKTYMEVVGLGLEGLAGLADTLKLPKSKAAVPYGKMCGAVWAKVKEVREGTKAKADAPKAKQGVGGTVSQGTVLAGITTSEKADKTPLKQAAQTAKVDAPKVDADPIVPGLFGADGKPVTVAQVYAALNKVGLAK